MEIVVIVVVVLENHSSVDLTEGKGMSRRKLMRRGMSWRVGEFLWLFVQLVEERMDQQFHSMTNADDSQDESNLTSC